MRIIQTEINNQIQTLNHILDLVQKYYKDLDLFEPMNPKQIFHFAQSRYKREQVETLMRPKYYLQKRLYGDCDDFTILFLSYWLRRELNLNDCFLVLAGRYRISHVYPILSVNDSYNEKKILIGFDALPENKYGYVYIYPLMQIYPIFLDSNGTFKVKNFLTINQFSRKAIDKNYKVFYDFK